MSNLTLDLLAFMCQLKILCNPALMVQENGSGSIDFCFWVEYFYIVYKNRIQFDTRERWENPAMGWSSSGDPLAGLDLEFSSREAAEVYCQRMGTFFV